MCILSLSLKRDSELIITHGVNSHMGQTLEATYLLYPYKHNIISLYMLIVTSLSIHSKAAKFQRLLIGQSIVKCNDECYQGLRRIYIKHSKLDATSDHS